MRFQVVRRKYRITKLRMMFNVIQCMYNLKKLLDERKKTRRYRSCGVRKINLDRKSNGYFNVTFLPMKNHCTDQFYIQTRMNISTYEYVLNLLSPHLQKFSIREAISPECRLAITLT